jgi:multiple sugar transport system ATP-binding protein
MLPAEVEVIEPLGDEVIVHARVGDELLVYKVEPQLTPDVGQKLEIALELDRLHLFDVETEKRLGT